MDDGSSVPPDWKRYLNVQFTIMQTRNGDWDAFENIVALAVRNNMKMSVWWTGLYRRLRLTSDSWTSWLTVQGFNFNPTPKRTHQCRAWQNLSIQPTNRLVSLWWPLEDKVALTEQCCAFLQSVKMLIKLGDRWRSAYSSNEHVPGKLTDWFLSEKWRFGATGRGNEAIFVALWSISTVSLLLLLQGGDSESITDFWICHLLAILTFSLSHFVWTSLSM